MRDNDLVADSLGKNLLSLRTAMLVLGGALAGLSGAILVGFITLWAPSAWGYAETIVLFAAVIIGGAGNHRGAVLGAILVPVAFEEATRYIPAIPGRPGLVDDLQWVAIGLLIVLFLWFRPQGVLPERRRRIAAGRPPSARPNEDVLTLAGDGRVLMIQPAVFLLDEPTANLAPQVAAELFTSHVKALAEAGAAVLVVEQRARAVLAISDYTYVLGGGRVLMDGTPARLAASQEFTESFFGATRDLR